MSQLMAGFARVNITPPLGTYISGYFIDRYATGVLDELEANCAAFSCDDKKLVLITVDHVGIYREAMEEFIREICDRTGLPEAAVFIHVTHTHTSGPFFEPDTKDEKILHYRRVLRYKLADAAEMALQDLKPAKMATAHGEAPGIAFIRRYVMKDGSIKTNPGVNNPEIDHPVGETDNEVTMLRFDREDAETLVLVNFGCHPDTIGGTKLSADWPGFVRRTVENAIENTRCLMFNGAQGDVNHVNVHPGPGYMNGDMIIDFDGVARGYSHARYMGRVIAAAVMQIYDKAEYEDAASIGYAKEELAVPSNMPSPEELPAARYIHEMHLAGRDAELPYKEMELTTMVAEAGRMIRLEHGPEVFSMPLTAVRIGSAGLFGVPGEPFNGVGRGLKKAKGYRAVLPCINTNAKEGYFPLKECYEQGGYEARSSRYKAGAAELIIENGCRMLESLLPDSSENILR